LLLVVIVVLLPLICHLFCSKLYFNLWFYLRKFANCMLFSIISFLLGFGAYWIEMNSAKLPWVAVRLFIYIWGELEQLVLISYLEHINILILISILNLKQSPLEYWYWYRIRNRGLQNIDIDIEFETEAPRILILILNSKQKPPEYWYWYRNRNKG